MTSDDKIQMNKAAVHNNDGDHLYTCQKFPPISNSPIKQNAKMD